MEPPEDQIWQVAFQYHKLHRFYAKSAHQLLRLFEMTQIDLPLQISEMQLDIGN